MEQRPSPDALLEEARREGGGSGRLKIFVGAAPGVGKTFEMLQSARAKRAEGVDVVVGIVETHGRRETQALLDGLEVIERRHVAHRGRTLEEMDLDAIIARRPRLVLVDELAHSNAPGSRHPKRYLDVEELLARGIDVYTTVNIQHIESLNDVVAQITGVRVQETVPDRVFDGAQAVELVDLTPDDLIQRLREGKVYVPAQAERALQNFFSPANLTALRELALRRTAERVDDQLVTEMQARAIPGPWAASDRILVCVGSQPGAAALVRYAKRLADRLRAPFTALHVEGRRSRQLTEVERDRVATTLRLAQTLGGEAITIPRDIGRDTAAVILGYAQDHNFTQIVLGTPVTPRWLRSLRGSLMQDVVQGAGSASVHVVGRGRDAAGDAREDARVGDVRPDLQPAGFAMALLFVAAALGLAELLLPVLGLESVDLVFLGAVVAVALRFGLLPSLVASVAASLCYNFFFLPPLYTFTIADPTNIAAFAFLTVTAVIVSNMASRVRMQAIMAAGRARTTEALYAFGRKLASTGQLDDVLWVAVHQVALMLKVHAMVLLPEDGRLAVKAGYPPEDTLDDGDLAAASWCWEHDRVAGRGSDTLPGARRLFLPMRTGRGPVGVVGIERPVSGALLSPDDRRLLDALLDHAALAIERIRLMEAMEKARRTMETENLRSALLTSISHDLKTPLAAVLGAAGALRGLGDSLSTAQRADLLDTIVDESERLNRFIANLLDMTRLESGAVRPNAALHEIGDVVEGALRRAARILAGHRVEVRLAPEMPLVEVDPILLEQVFFNLLDNAAKYAPAGSLITIVGEHDRTGVRVHVLDEGEGIPSADLTRVFDKFFRVEKRDVVRAGTGLGLAIARGFVEAMKGTIAAKNRTDRTGAMVTVTLPLPSTLERDASAA